MTNNSIQGPLIPLPELVRQQKAQGKKRNIQFSPLLSLEGPSYFGLAALGRGMKAGEAGMAGFPLLSGSYVWPVSHRVDGVMSLATPGKGPLSWSPQDCELEQL